MLLRKEKGLKSRRVWGVLVVVVALAVEETFHRDTVVAAKAG